MGVEAPQAGTGLRAEYFSTTTLENRVALRIDSTIDINLECPNVPIPGLTQDAYSIRWTGQVEAPVNGYFNFVTYSDDGVRFWLNGIKLIDNWGIHPVTRDVSRAVYLASGQKYDIRLEYFQGKCYPARIRLAWLYPGQIESTVPQARLYPTRSPYPDYTDTSRGIAAEYLL
jgi:hypothetical protein